MAAAFAGLGVRRAIKALMLVLVATFGVVSASAQQVETSLPLSQRYTINLAAGMPAYIGDASSTSSASQSQWWFQSSNNSTNYASPTFVESADAQARWQQLGLPYDQTVSRTFINQTSGGGQGSLISTDHWYRLHFKVDPKYTGQKFALELEGAHTGVQVYINGTLLRGVSSVAADAQATHVVGFVPVVVDLTPFLHTDGSADNVIAVDVASNTNSWFEAPGFSQAFRFGQAMTGLFRDVKLVVMNPVHIPLNVYSNQKTWGTYVGTVSEVAASSGTATAASAVVEVQTNVLNESTTTQQVTLTTQIVDAKGDVVVTAPPITKSLPPMTASTFPSTPEPIFRQQITVPNPTLWYPNNSTYGTPYMYRVYHIVSVNGTVVDSAQSPLGIRTVTWDSNFPYFNGHAMNLWGGSGRYDYPGLGSSVPDEQQWRDLSLLAAEGGNVWRPGHSTTSEEFVEAADAYGIVIVQPSGDGEGNFNLSDTPPPSADTIALKEEVHRDMIIRDRSHPSIIFWEEDNGGNNATLAAYLADLEAKWDSIAPRQQADRTYSPSYAFIDECDGAGCEVGNKNSNPSNPAFGAEYWDFLGTARGLAWDRELQFAAPFLDDWRKGRQANAFGMVQWYLSDEPGETGPFVEFPNDPNMSNYFRSYGNSSMDQNRFPKLLYYAYQANWIPYAVKPVVALAHNWNRAYEYTSGTPIQENAFSNCPSVRLLINGVAKDPLTGALLADQVPNPWNIQSGSDLTQNSTVMPGQVHWMVNWAPGTVTAQCLDTSGNVVPSATDTRTTAGSEYKIVLTAVPELVRPDGSSFQWTSNGSDAAFVVAQVVDAQGNVVPTAADNVTFSVSGPATYMGGTQQYVADPYWKTYYQDAFSQANANVISGVPYAFFHAPGDPELNFEGGLTKIALRSTITPGTVTVTASAPGLVSGSVQLSSVAPPALMQSQPPAIIVPPVDTAVTAGYSATFTVAASGSGTLNYQWYYKKTIVAGATGTSFTTPVTALSDNGSTVSVTVTSAGGFGTVSSNPVTLSVSAPANAAITTQPPSQTVVVGQSATLTVAASGSPQLNYAWYLNGTQVASGPQNSYTTPTLTTAGTQSFYVVVSNPLNQVQSSTGSLTVVAATPVSITSQPASQIAAANQPVQLSATVAGSSPFTYQWQFTPKGGATTILAGSTQSTNIISYTIPAMSSATAGAYTVTVNNAANAPVTSAAAQLTLAPPGVNLALNKPATASSTQNACTDTTTAPSLTGVGCLGAENAVDGNLNTRWASASAGVPPTTTVAGVDPSFLQVDLGSSQGFNTVILNWENAYAAKYAIEYTNADPATNPTWSIAYTNNAGAGGTETLTFPTVQARYVRVHGILRQSPYGYSLYEFQVYNVAQCGGSSERYSVNAANASLVTDNLLGLSWTRTIKTDTAPGSQFTGTDAVSYCSSINMRIPTAAEALNISGNNNASCAFPGAWNTWTSTVNPNDSTQTAIVSFDGTQSNKVTTNWPGATLCTTGTSSAQAPVIQTQPQPKAVVAGQAALFSVAATGTPAPHYQWMQNNIAIPGATSASYVTPVTALTDSGESFSVSVANGNGTVASSPAVLTVTNTSPGGGGGGGTGALTIATQPANQAVTVGSSATFSVVANSSGTLTYQWLRNGTAITGATAASYTTAATVAGDNGAQFSVVVTSSTSTTPVTSSTAVLTVLTSGNTGSADVIAIDAGSTVAVGSFKADTMCPAASQYNPGQPITIPSALNATAAPQQVYASACQGAQTYTLSGLVSGTSYTVVLHFAELYFQAAGSRQFNVAINGTPVAALQNFDIYAAAGNARFTALVKALTNVTAVNNQIVIMFTSGAKDQPMINGIEVQGPGSTGTASITAIDFGSPVAVGSFTADTTCGAAATYNPGHAVTIPPAIANIAAPEKVYESACQGTQNYTLAGLVAGNNYNVVLHFAELYFPTAGSRKFNVAINGTPVPELQNFDIFAAAGNAQFTAVVHSIANVAPVNGQIVVSFSGGTADQPMFNGLELQSASAGAGTGTAAPTITAQPGNVSVTIGSSATFSVTAGGTGPFTYQWQKGGTAIAGATSASYTTPATVASDNGSIFNVIVSNGSATTSNNATLTVTSAATPPSITTQPASQTATVGSTATFTVTAGGTGPFNYQWLKNNTAIAGATSATYTTPTLALSDSGESFTVTVGNSSGSSPATSTAATLTVGNYATYAGSIGVDLNNNTHGVWADGQIYVTVIGIDPANNHYAYVALGGTVTDFTAGDSTAANHLTQGGKNYGNYSFTLAQTKLLKLPLLTSARAFVSLGAPLYVQVNTDSTGKVTGYAGPNPQNPSDPNVNTHFDWYEFNNGTNGIFINTTQVDEFGLPLLLDVWGSGGTFHQETGITESVAQLDHEFATEVPAAFQPPTLSDLRILSPAKYSMAAGGANGNYFDSLVAGAWAGYAKQPLTITVGSRTFTGTASGSLLTFKEVNPPTQFAGETFVVHQPSTQDVLGCAGTMADGSPAAGGTDQSDRQLNLENQICSAINRGVLSTPANWNNVSTYYNASPANFYSQFWHKHSLGGLAYGFSYDDNNNQSTTIATGTPEHMAFGIGW